MKNKIILFLPMLLLLVLLGGCKDDDTPNAPRELADILYQTTWEAVENVYNDNDEVHIQDYYVFQFITHEKGTIMPQHDTMEHGGDFSYQIEGKIITFSGEVLRGAYTIIEQSEDKLVLQTYSPGKTVLTLHKLY